MRVIDHNPRAFITNAEVLQEILHRYLSVHRWEQGRKVFLGAVAAMEGRIEPILQRDVELAADMADGHPNLDARDLLHAASMSRLGVRRIATTDTRFDQILGIERLDPMLIDDRRHLRSDWRCPSDAVPANPPGFTAASRRFLCPRRYIAVIPETG
jgi:predicted nucleic acid-binding protein